MLLLPSTICIGQEGYIYTIAGCHNCSWGLTNGVPATTNTLLGAEGVCVDGQGYVYIAQKNGQVVRKIEPVSGLIYTVAGNGAQGFNGDGGAATNANLKNPVGICMNITGDLYIADAGNNRIRKVDAITGLISTVAGGGSDPGDGVAAITASISPVCVYADGADNLYIGTDYKVRKINLQTGIITTVAGNGTNAEAGDGGQALSASFSGTITCITEDVYGNMYIVSAAGRVRKIDAISGIINTVAGGGNSTAEGVPATTANLQGLSSCGVDVAGNIYLADNNHHKIREVDGLTGLINTICGNGNAAPDNVPALLAKTTGNLMYVDQGGTIYYSGGINNSDSFLYKIVGPTYLATDSFTTSIIKSCSNTTLSVRTKSYAAGMHIKVWWGDSQVPDDSTILSGNYGGYATMAHGYGLTGTYTIKMVLYDGNAKIDSLHITYSHAFCNSTIANFYLDVNGNCMKDSSDVLIYHPLLVEVDSNNVAIDTISTISGFYYNAYGAQGDIYKFKIIAPPSGTQASCPADGIITTTLQNTNVTPVNQIGFNCVVGNNFDLSVDAVIPVTGVLDQWGNVFVSNNYCTPENATVTLAVSPKYGSVSGVPTPTSIIGNTITWNLTNLSTNDPEPVKLYYMATGVVMVNDTVQTHITVAPTTGDQDPTNNVIIVHDTVKGSCDPNLMEVSPEGHILSGWGLKYRVEFENVGNDTAFNIYVLDTLPNELDANSLRIVSSTHKMYISKFNDGQHNIVKFDFPDIDLLDSSHHGECTGTFTYTINSKTGLPDGTLIDHSAGIYFDANGVIQTNTVENIIGFPAGVEQVSNDDKVQVYPNPAVNELMIKADKELYSSCVITNSLGQVVMQHTLNSAETKLNVKVLPAGVYYITLKGEKGSEVRRFVKL